MKKFELSQDVKDKLAVCVGIFDDIENQIFEKKGYAITANDKKMIDDLFGSDILQSFDLPPLNEKRKQIKYKFGDGRIALYDVGVVFKKIANVCHLQNTYFNPTDLYFLEHIGLQGKRIFLSGGLKNYRVSDYPKIYQSYGYHRPNRFFYKFMFLDC